MRTATFALFLALGLSVQAAGPVPRPSKEFTVTTPQGQQILLSHEKGKVVVVQFLFSHGARTAKLSQMLTQLNMEYGSCRGFQALGVAFNEQDSPDDKIPLKDKAAAYSKQYAGFPVGIPAETGPTLKGPRTLVLDYLGISEMERIGVPEIVVIDRKGVIREQSPTEGGGPLTNEMHLRSLIESLLAESAGAKAPAKSGDSTTKPAEKKTADKKTS